MALPLPAMVRLLAASVLFGCTMPALAGIFSVTPVRIYMAPRDRAVAVTLVNEGDSELALQADVHAWTQTPDGKDALVLTEDLILSPPMIRLAPKARQVVRLALLRPPDPARQLTYRLIVREIPEVTAPKDRTLAVPVALALSMPVFITPPNARREVGCTVERAPEGLQATCINAGTAYAQIREAALVRGTARLGQFDGGLYLLPGARNAVPLKDGDPAAGGPAVLNVLFDDGKSQAFNVEVP